MNCIELFQKLSKLQNEADELEILRQCLLILTEVDDRDRLADDDYLFEVWQEINLRVQAANDQHAAMTEELENLAKSDPRKFAPEQIWILVRAIKVQSQLLRLYAGDASYELS